MMECTIENKKMVPLSMAVNAAMIDTYADRGRATQRFSHWASRGLKELYSHALPKIKHKVWLTVNKNTHTATLPLDFSHETFIGFIDARWHKVPLKLNNSIVDSRNIVDVECEDACPKCKQDKSICNDLVITEEKNIIVINDSTYEETIIKKLYPNGDYYLETTTPYLNIGTNNVEYAPPKKEFIVNFDLKPCGCLETTQQNTDNLIKFCPDIYCNYYAPCDSACNTSVGGYKVFTETGLIQMDHHYPYDKVYIEYDGFITKIKGQYYIPYVAFETVVEWIKLRAIKDNKNVPRWQKLDQERYYTTAKGNMMIVLRRASLAYIMQSISSLPKFDVDYNNDYWSYNQCFNSPQSQLIADSVASNSSINNSGGTVINNTTTIINRTAFVLTVKTGDGIGYPVDGQSTYQNNVLKGAMDVEYLILGNQIFTKKAGQFDIDSVTGTVDISPSKFVAPDVLILNYNKNV